MGNRSVNPKFCQAGSAGALMDRRGLLKLGLLGTGGLSLSSLLHQEATASTVAGSKRANSIILLHMRGGPSQHET